MHQNSPTDIENLHAIYNRLTGFKLSTRYDRERSWYEFMKAGFNAEDLKLVLVHLKGQIKRKERHSGSLRFSNLIECLNMFEEERELARNHLLRSKPAPSDKEQVIQLFRPVVAESTLTVNCKPAKVVMDKLIDQLRRAIE